MTIQLKLNWKQKKIMKTLESEKNHKVTIVFFVVIKE